MKHFWATLLTGVMLVVISATALATTYDVGDGKPYTSIGAVPWESLNAGDTVNIYYRSTPYKEKFVLGRVGTESQPITVHGVPGPGGELPVIDGQNATTRLALETGSEARGIITMQQWTTVPPACRPSYIVIENLEFKNASVPYTFTDDAGASQSYVNSSAAVWIADGRHVTVRNCYIHDCGNGVFSYTADSGADNWSEDILVEGNYVTNCGNAGSVYEHTSYTESFKITFQYNHYGPPRGGDTASIGNALKDRSAGLVVRYNWIEGGNRTLDIVDPEDSGTLGTDPLYQKTFIYGNFLIERNDVGNRQVVHFGGDMGGVYRPKGYFYNNTVVSYRSGYTTLVMENGGSSSVFDCRNNIIYVTGAGSDLEVSNDSDGVVNMTHNWLKTGYRLVGGSGGTVNDDATSVTGTSPGFTNEGAQDFTLAAGSACINAGTSLHADAAAAGHYLYYQYVKHQAYESRPNDGQIDIGANERPGGTIPDLQITTTSLPNGQVTVAYSQTLAATGGQPPYTWSILSGSLPAGLSLASSNGVISGTPTTSGTSNFTVRCADSQGTPDTDDQPLSITVTLLPVQITGPTFMRNAQQNVHYSQQLSAGQGQAPYAWSVVSGSLPAGLSLASSTGVISGSPTTLGTSNFTIRVQDSQGTPDSTTKAYSITVAAASGNTYWVAASGGGDGNPGTWQQPWATIQHAVDTVANGDTILVQPGLHYGVRITNSGTSGSPKKVLSETVGAATLNHPSASQTYNANVELENANYWVVDGFKIDGVNKTYSLLNMTSADYVTVRNCEGFQGNSTGFYAPYCDYALFENNLVYNCGGSGIYCLNSADGGTLRGNIVHDTASCGIKLDGYYDGDRIMSNWLVERNQCYMNVNGIYLDAVELSTFRNNLVYFDNSKAMTMVCIDGLTTPRNNRVLNNTMVNKSTAYYNVFIFNEYGAPAGVGNAFYNNILYNYNTAVNRGSFCIDSAIDSQFTSDYNVVMNGFGFDDNATYCDFATWKSTHGHDLHSIQAADTALFVDAANYDYHLKTDSPAKDAGTTLADCTNDINGVSRPQGSAYDIGCYELTTGPAALNITTTTLPNGQIGVAYGQTVQATGGVTPYSWSIVSGNLPAGLSLGPSTGTISGTPTASGTSSFTVRVTDSDTPASTDDQPLSIYIPADLAVTTSSLPDGQIGVAYSQALAATGGVTPYSWSLASGSLPAGLSLSSGGVVSGTPTTTGTSNFTVRVTDSQGPADTATKALSIKINAATLVITTTSLPNGAVGAAYSQTVKATGGVTPYSWSIVSGFLPAGLSLGSSTGTISGTPTTSGTSNFTIRVTDSQTPTPATDDQALSITVNAAPADLVITTTTLPNGMVGTAYSQTVQATGGVTPYSWSIVSGSLPAGLSLGSSTGTISGTPTAYGTSNFTVRVTDSQAPADTDDQALSIYVAPADLVITTTSLPNGTVGAAYSQTVQATGGVTPYSWSVVSGSLPVGLSLGSSTGTISGTPTAAATSNFTVRVTDSQTPTPDTDDQALSITVSAAGETYKIASDDTVSQTTSASYQTKLTLQWTPAEADDWIVIAYAEHSVTGWGSHAARMTLDGAVEGEEVRRTRGSDYFPFYAMKVATLSAAQHTVTIDYLSTDGGTASIRNARIVAIRKASLEWSQTAADSQQTITTTPTDFVTMNFTPSSAGNYLLIWAAEVHSQYGVNMTAQSRLDGAAMHDSLIQNKGNDNEATPLATFVAQNLTAAQHTMTIRASTPSTSGWIRRCRVAAVRLSGGRFADYAYAADDNESTTTSTTFVEKLSKSWTSGATGNWLALMSASTGQSSSYRGVESRMQYNDATTLSTNLQMPMDAVEYLPAAGVGIINVTDGSRKTDVDYRTDNSSYTAKIKNVHLAMLPLDTGGVADLDITTTSLPNGQIGVAYSQTVQATGGVTPYSWSIVSGSLPAGLSLGSSTGTMSGTPTASGTSNFTVRVTDSQGTPDTDDQALSIYIPADLVVTTSSLANGQIGVAYSQTLGATGGVTPYSWSLASGSLPAGLSVSSGGVISGTPTASGTSNFTVRVTDSQTPADTATKALSIYIPADLVVTTSNLANGQIGVAYSQTLAATGGVTPYSWSLASGSLPAGLSLSSGGVISGTPTASGTSNFTVRVTDSQTPADTATKALSIYIPADLVITTSTLPNGTVATAYSQTVSATGGVTPYSWSLASGSLPAGLSLSSGGVISGTPTASGTSNFTVRVTDSQTPADTATKALSITVTGGQANSTYEFIASDGESSTTSTSYQTKASLAFTTYTSDDWVIFAFAEYKGSSASSSTLVQVTVDAATEADITVEPNDTTDYQSFMASKKATLAAGSHTVNLQYRSESTSATARIRNARLVAVPKGALVMATNAADSTVALTTTLTNYVTMNFTPATAGYYLIVWTAEASANTSYSTQVEARLNGAAQDTMLVESKDNTDYYTFASFQVASCPASQQTVTVAAAKETGSSATHNIRRARVAAIRLTGSRFANYRSVSADTESTTTSTSFQQKLTDSWSPSPVGNWLVLTSFRLAGTSASYSVEGRVQLDDATTMAQPLREPNDTTDYMQGGSVDVRSLLSGTRKLDVDYRSESTSMTAKIRAARIVALPLD